MITTFELRDPRAKVIDRPNRLDRYLLALLNDPRDLPFMHLILQSSLVLIPFAIFLFIPGCFRWWLGGLYLVINFSMFIDRFILMLHNTSHRPLFKRPYRLLNQYIPWILSPLFGETPNTYYAHHIGMHHPENNLEQDLSSTMAYQRDNPLHFARYFTRFFFGIIFELSAYMWRRRRFRLIRRMLTGELLFIATAVVLLFVNPLPALVVFVIPLLFTRFMMMAGNWGQHAFIDAAAPENCYRNSITCINSRYNRRCFNDGYHIGHHLRANRHWTDMPAELEQNRQRYAQEGAIVFSGIDFFMVWFYLMFKNYRALARQYVVLGERLPSEDDVIQLLKERTRIISPQPALAPVTDPLTNP